MVLASFSGSR